MTDELRMGAYYYGFAQTGARVVDKVLSAVACAGKAFHHTSEWNDDAKWDGHTGETPVDWIQNAADEAAAEIDRLRQALGEMVTTFYDAGCHICGGDCASANPPVGGCPVGVIQRARAALGKDQT
jgi:hypothetical protein